MSGRIVWCLAIAVSILSILLAGTIGIIAWKFISEDSADEEFDLQKAFPGYFRSSYEQSVFVVEYRKSVSFPPTKKSPNCTFVCPDERLESESTSESTLNPPDELRPVREAKRLTRTKRDPAEDDLILHGPVYHSCCQSWTVLSAPETAVTVDGQEVEIVQTDDYKQYFEQEHCEQYNGNCDCQCETTPYVTNAVYYKNKKAKKSKNKYGLIQIVLDGCCKCLNVQRRSG